MKGRASPYTSSQNHRNFLLAEIAASLAVIDLKYHQSCSFDNNNRNKWLSWAARPSISWRSECNTYVVEHCKSCCWEADKQAADKDHARSVRLLYAQQ